MHVSSRQVAVSVHRGEITLFNSKFRGHDTGKTTTAEQRGGTVLSFVACDTLMNILTDTVPIDRISFMKIDIGGAEAPLLPEIVENKDKFAPRLVVVSEVAENNIGCIDFFRQRGFQFFFLENYYSFEGCLGASSRREDELGRLKTLGDKAERPPIADLVFVYERAAKN